MDIEEIFELNKNQFKLWCDFCLDNTIEMYENKDSYMNVWDREKEKYLVYVQRHEQTGIKKFLEKVLDTY
tara:strand:+ start:150 stop:359 length:210 start_codon:yes stop_codon:yes gene_type:complete